MYLFILLLVAGSAFFSGSETALSSFNRIRMRNRAESGDKGAALALKIADDYDKTISTILIGNNIVNMASSSLGTVMAVALVGQQWGPTVSTVVMTLLVLIFGEILPKSLAKEHAESIAIRAAGIIDLLRKLFTPLVLFFVLLKKLAFGRKAADDQPSVTEDELKTIIDTVEEEGVLDSQETDIIQSVIDFDDITVDTVEEEGVLDSQETDIIQSVIDFDDITVQEILIPRVDMLAVDVNEPVDQVIATVLANSYTRIPVYENDIDHIIGMLHTRDLFNCLAQNKPVNVRELCRDIPFVYRTKHINDLLELVGEIFDETDEVEELPIQKLEDNLYRVAGEVNIDDLFDELDLKFKGFESDYSSVAGWALECLEHIPEPGEHFVFQNLHVTVEKVEDKRILSLLVRIESKPEEETHQ